MQRKEKERDLLKKAMENINMERKPGYYNVGPAKTAEPNNYGLDIFSEPENLNMHLDPINPITRTIEQIRDYITRTDLPSWETDYLRNEINRMMDMPEPKLKTYTKDQLDRLVNTKSEEKCGDEVQIYVHDNKQAGECNNKKKLEADPDKQSDETTEHVNNNYPKYKTPHDNVHVQWFNENIGKAWSWLQSEKAKTDEIDNPKPVLTFVCDFITLYMANVFPEAMSDELWALVEILTGTWLDIKHSHTETHVTDDSTSPNPTDSSDNPMSSYMQELIDRDLEAVHNGLIKAAVENVSFTEDPHTENPLNNPLEELKQHSMETLEKLSREPKSMATDSKPKHMTTSDLKKAIDKARNLMDRIDGRQEDTTTEQVRTHNIGESDYSKHRIQPWDIWDEYQLNPWDADIVKRTIRTKREPGKTPEESRIMDYEKIIHVAQERIRQIRTNGHV